MKTVTYSRAADYDELIGLVGDPDGAEDWDDEEGDHAFAELARERLAERETEAGLTLPRSVWTELRGGAEPVRLLRRRRGLTQAELAAAADVEQGYLSRIESGDESPTVQALRALARALAVPVVALIAEPPPTA